MSKVLIAVGVAILLSFASHVALNPNRISSLKSAEIKDFTFPENTEVKASGFKEWITKYNKQYSTMELPIRFKVWSDNHDIVERHNAKKLSWTLEMNHLADLTSEEHAALNLGFNPSIMNTLSPNVELLNESYTAPYVDWKSKGAVSPVKNQAMCGASWAFATADALEGLYKLKNRGPVPVFSTQQLIDCSDIYGNRGCNGGAMVAAYQYTENYGIELDSTYPYKASKGNCRHTLPNAIFKNSHYRSVLRDSYNQLQVAVTAQPVTVAIQADQSIFQLYKSGIISSECGTDLNHAMTVVGYTVSEGISYWIVKNQWGSNWGNEGYVHIVRGSQNSGSGVCGINMMGSYPI